MLLPADNASVEEAFCSLLLPLCDLNWWGDAVSWLAYQLLDKSHRLDMTGSSII